MKRPIQWHIDCLKGWRESLERKKQEVDNARKELERMQGKLLIYAMQIDRAKKLGKDGFDEDKFKPFTT
jgi:hypothetical protein